MNFTKKYPLKIRETKINSTLAKISISQPEVAEWQLRNNGGCATMRCPSNLSIPVFGKLTEVRSSLCHCLSIGVICSPTNRFLRFS